MHVFEIDTINVYYLSWGYLPKKKVSDKDIRNYYGKNAFFSITDKDTIESFQDCLSIFNFQETDNLDSSVYMLMDFILSNGEKRTLKFRKSKVCEYNSHSFINVKLVECINRYIPLTDAPN